MTKTRRGIFGIRIHVDSLLFFLRTPYGTTLAALFVIFLLMNTLYLHRMPGLFGDEASEGENVYEILNSDTLINVFGERSYIGPLIDHVRIPFIGLFGYTALALRVPMLLVSIGTFFLAAAVLRRLFGTLPGLFALAFFAFAPTYLIYQRLGWAVTLFPFFAALLLWTLTREPRPSQPLLAGFVAGLGLQNYITFFPTIAAIVIPWTARLVVYEGAATTVRRWWPFLLGFWAGFGTQFGVLNMYKEDQGDPEAVAKLFWTRVEDLRRVASDVLSGSVYAASYTGAPFHPQVIKVILILISIGVLAALFLSRKKLAAWAWVLGLLIQLTVLLVMIDRFTLRYFVVFVLGTWTLSGVGVGILVERFFRPQKPFLMPFMSLIPAAALSLFVGVVVFIPFLRTGGRFAYFSLDNPKSTAELKVDLRPLLQCLRGRSPVYSDDIHIRNRLLYLQHSERGLFVASGQETTDWMVRHRPPSTKPTSDEACPELVNFRVTKRD